LGLKFPSVGLAMPTGLRRYYGKGDLHFITFSCYRRLPLLKTVGARDVFLKELGKVRNEMGFHLLGYVVMAGGSQNFPEEFSWACSTGRVYHPDIIHCSLEAGVPHPSGLRVRVFLRCAILCGAITDWEIFTSLRLVVIGDVRFSEHGVPATAS
jgi:hypothetical protein